MQDAMIALAAAAGTALAAAMATDAWETARDRTVRLFRYRQEDQRAIEARLDRNVDQCRNAVDPERVRQAIVATWQLELEDLLAAHPVAADEVEELVSQVRAALPGTQQGWMQTNIAKDDGRVFAVQGGNLIMHPDGIPGDRVLPSRDAEESDSSGGTE
ncbi:hypothetical protein AB0J25_07190 [Streptomyces sp. NPDC049910]|uniref:hypothetical protein n=1 Tax=Streptomyces sp. NPDC049910 TaxID=3155278 RepID=UPI003424B62B